MANRQLAAIMFTNMVGYTALMQQNEPLALQQRHKSRKILDETLEKYEGKLLQQQKLPDPPTLYPLLAWLYLGIGDKQKFYENYEISVRKKLFGALHSYNSPLLSEVAGEERILNLRREYGLPL